jgi:hypothetical protein
MQFLLSNFDVYLFFEKWNSIIEMGGADLGAQANQKKKLPIANRIIQ